MDLLAREPRNGIEPPEPGSCVLVGPPGSGKTAFLAALGTAFELDRRPEWTRFVADPRLPARAGARAANSPGTGTTAPAPSWSTYSFQLGMNADPAAGTGGEFELSVLDTPGAFFDAIARRDGGALNPEAVADLVRATRNARCLVLFIDAESEFSTGMLDLAGVIDHLLVLAHTRLPRVGAKAWPGSEPPWQRAPRLELPFERVLLLLTRVEVLCARMAETLAWCHEHWLDADPAELKDVLQHGPLDAWGVAELLDVPALIRRRVSGLDSLRSSLKPGASLALSVLSTNGFAASSPTETGRAARALNSTASLPQTPPESRRWNPRDRRSNTGNTVRTGVPFGVWPALFFMATGRAAPPVMLLTQPGRRTPDNRLMEKQS